MEKVKRSLQYRQLTKPILFWLFAYMLLTYIYSTAFDSYRLGSVVILMLLPIHVGYYYLLIHFPLRAFLKGRYFTAILTSFIIMFVVAALYRIAEIFVTDPYIYRYYIARDSNFQWHKLDGTWWQQFKRNGDFVNAIERSNVVVWIAVTVRLFSFWHERKQAVLQAELNSLKAQLHPHFLFNSLNNLYALSLSNSPQTPEVILGLSNILRYVIYEGSADFVSLERDVIVLKDYIAIENLRYEDRLDLNADFQQNLSPWKIAPLLMLPLVENAFKHGAAETVDNPWINIELQVVGDELVFKISNNKPESTSGTVNNRSERIGLNNVAHRLKLLYPGAHTLQWHDEQDCFIVELKINLARLPD